MKPMTLEKSAVGSVPYRLYDLTINDIEERKKKSLVIKCGRDVLAYLGLARHDLTNCIQPGKRVFSAKLNKTYAIRIEKVTKN